MHVDVHFAGFQARTLGQLTSILCLLGYSMTFNFHNHALAVAIQAAGGVDCYQEVA